MEKTMHFCDICGVKIREDKTRINYKKKIQVIFTTDQTEGRSCNPYLCISELDICDECMKKVLQGNYIYAHGAQGYNTYYFKGGQNEQT